jgi:hypothetical protein
MQLVQETAGELSQPMATWAPRVISWPMVVSITNLCRRTSAISKSDFVIVGAEFAEETTILDNIGRPLNPPDSELHLLLTSKLYASSSESASVTVANVDKMVLDQLADMSQVNSEAPNQSSNVQQGKANFLIATQANKSRWVLKATVDGGEKTFCHRQDLSSMLENSSKGTKSLNSGNTFLFEDVLEFIHQRICPSWWQLFCSVLHIQHIPKDLLVNVSASISFGQLLFLYCLLCIRRPHDG